MVKDIISVYKDRIEKVDWMSAQTKEKAIRKLDKMNIKIGYPDKFDTYLDNVDIKSAADGGSYFDNILEISKASKAEALRHQGQTVDKTKWQMYPYTVNACYGDLSHVGIFAGKDAAGNILVIHCSSGRNNVVITTNSGFGFAARPSAY